MPKQNDKRKKPANSSILFFYIFVFLYLGLVFHTSSNGRIFGKYSLSYFILLITFPLLFWFLTKMLTVFFQISKIHVGNKKFTLLINQKLLLLSTLLGLSFFVTESYFRKYDIRPTTRQTLPKEDFHPFLQLQNSQKDNKIRPQLHINKEGFRGEEIEGEKSENTYRIFFLGGSTVLNEHTPYEENSSRILEKLLQSYYPAKKIEVFNAGVRYYNSEHSIIQYLFKIKDFSPDLLVVWQGANDMAVSCADVGNDTYGQYKNDYSHKFGPLITVFNYFYSSPRAINLLTFDYLNFIIGNTFYSDFKTQGKRSDAPPKPPGRPVGMTFQSINAYKRNLRSLIKIAGEDGVRLILGNQPYLYNDKLDNNHSWDLEWVCRSENTYPNISSLTKGIRQFNDATREIANSENVPFVDIEAKLPKSEEYFSDDFHFYSAKSNSIVANTLFEYIVKNSLISD